MRYLTVLLVLLTGCSYVNTIGLVGSKRFVKVQLGSLTAPGQTLLVIEDVNTHEITMMTPVAGNGVVPSLLTAGGIAGGAVALGNSFRRESTIYNNSQSSARVIEDDPPSPPMPTRPPVNRPPPKGWK